MSANHYPRTHSTNKNRRETDLGYPSDVNNTWHGNQFNEFENRERYMETQLAGEHDNCDSNANQNEVLDDEPYPPPGLRRLVTGQTVSFDDGLSSPPFDRIVPGEGNTVNNQPPPLVSKIHDSTALSERFVSGSMVKDYNLVHQQVFSSMQKKEMSNYFDDDDEEYATSRSQQRYYERRPPREPNYRSYHPDSSFRKERSYRERRSEYNSRYENFIDYERTSRPSSRSGSEYRRDIMDYNNSRYHRLPEYYKYLDHRLILRYSAGHRMHKSDIEYWAKVRDSEPHKYMDWFKVTFPEEYADWYSQYVLHKSTHSTGSYRTDRRGSGHSGQSSMDNDSISVNDDKSSIREQAVFRPVDLERASVTQEIRNSPCKFTIPHIKGIFNALGQLLVINPRSPQDGQPADISIHQLLPPDDDPDYVEFMNFTGPFIVGETHVKTISEFVRCHADMASSSSEKLLYLLIDRIITLRGATDGIAISELLMTNYRESQNQNPLATKEDIVKQSSLSDIFVTKDDAIKQSDHSNLSEAEIIEKYTNLLLEGDKNAALEWAVNHKLWGHAFLFASKIGPKHYSNVLMKFDNSIPMNSPLKTLYQLYSNQVPQAATACSDEKWGDWRSHLAMMLSNPSADSELNKSAIIALGDSLGNKNIFASHFCYLAAQADFDLPSKPTTKLTLLSLRNIDNFGINTPNHAILLTQAYEFAKRLQRIDYTIPALLPYKYLLATRLIDYGKNTIALQYLESIATDLLKNENNRDMNLMQNVLELAERIKYSDSKSYFVDSSVDNSWLTSLHQLVNEKRYHTPQFVSLHNMHISKETPSFSNQQQERRPSMPEARLTQPLSQLSSLQHQQPQKIQKHQLYQQNQPHSSQQPTLYSVPISNEIQQPYGIHIPTSHGQQQQPPSLPVSSPQHTWNASSYGPSCLDADSSGSYNQWAPPQTQQFKTEPSVDVNDNVSHQQKDDFNTQPLNSSLIDQESSFYSPWDQPQQPVSISMHSNSKNFYDENNEPVTPKDPNNRAKKEEPSTSQPVSKELDKNGTEPNLENSKKGNIISNLIGRLSMKSKNQMKLPDDKNKTIVFDKEKNMWVDTSESSSDSEKMNSIKPPPKVSDLQSFRPIITSDQGAKLSSTPSVPLGTSTPVNGQNLVPGSSSSIGNGYKIPKGRGMKANYVNVLSQNKISTPASNISLNSLTESYAGSQVPSNMFVPPSVNGNVASFDESSTHHQTPENVAQSRNSNQEVPLFFNPTLFSSVG